MKKILHKFEMNEHKAEILHSFRITEHFGEPFLAEHKSTAVLQVLKFRKKIYLGVRFWDREEKCEHTVLYRKTMPVSRFKPEKMFHQFQELLENIHHKEIYAHDVVKLIAQQELLPNELKPYLIEDCHDDSEYILKHKKYNVEHHKIFNHALNDSFSLAHARDIVSSIL